MLARVDGVRRLRVFFSAAKEGCRLARPLSSGAAFLAVLSIWVEAAASLRKTDAALRALGPANAIYLRIYAAAQNPSNFEDEPKPSNASTRSPYTKGLAVCQIQDPYEEAESYSVIRRARDIIARNRGPAAIISASASHTCTSDPVELTCQASLRTTTQQ